MANNRNDDMNRNGNKNTPQDRTSQGQGGNFNQGTTDPVNQDRAMNRDREIGQGSSGTEQGRQGGFGNTGSTATGSMGSTRDTGLGNRAESANRGSELGNRGNQSGNRDNQSDE